VKDEVTYGNTLTALSAVHCDLPAAAANVKLIGTYDPEKDKRVVRTVKQAAGPRYTSARSFEAKTASSKPVYT
jgi:hypothetical protein